MLACFLSRNLKVGFQGLSCLHPSAFCIRFSREALPGYISRLHFLLFLLWTAARDSPGGAFWSTNGTPAAKPRGWDLLEFNFQLEKAQLNQPTKRSKQQKAHIPQKQRTKKFFKRSKQPPTPAPNPNPSNLKQRSHWMRVMQ